MCARGGYAQFIVGVQITPTHPEAVGGAFVYRVAREMSGCGRPVFRHKIRHTCQPPSKKRKDYASKFRILCKK